MSAASAPLPKGSKPDKLIRDAIILELHRMTEDENGKKVKYLQRIAHKLVVAGAEGKIDAIKEIGDRVDGKPAPQIAILGNQMAVSFVLQNGPQAIEGSFTEGPMQLVGAPEDDP
jgi:hypothetical protein